MSKKGSFLRTAKRRPKVVNFNDAVVDKLVKQLGAWINETEEEARETEKHVRRWLMAGNTPDQILKRHQESLDAMPGNDGGDE
ncbi:MAG: hypothetical protein ABJN62_09705 [Halioglobus sp.]